MRRASYTISYFQALADVMSAVIDALCKYFFVILRGHKTGSETMLLSILLTESNLRA